MDFDFRKLSSQLAPLINVIKDVKDDKNVTNAKHNETKENIGETDVIVPQNWSNSSIKT